MKYSIGFDVYGTLVDPVEMKQHLHRLVGDKAELFAQMWHDKKVEYAFRRGLMQKYDHFGVCTLHALHYCMQVFKVDLSEQEQQRLMQELQNLQAFSDVIPGLKNLKQQGHKLVAFSNGPETIVRTLLERTEVLPHLEDVISVDEVKTFKPDPAVYQHLVKRTDSSNSNCWLVSSNPWDVIGAKAAGLNAAWIKRSPDKVFDPWGIEPNLIVSDLMELAGRIGG